MRGVPCKRQHHPGHTHLVHIPIPRKPLRRQSETLTAISYNSHYGMGISYLLHSPACVALEQQPRLPVWISLWLPPRLRFPRTISLSSHLIPTSQGIRWADFDELVVVESLTRRAKDVLLRDEVKLEVGCWRTNWRVPLRDLVNPTWH